MRTADRDFFTANAAQAHFGERTNNGSRSEGYPHTGAQRRMSAPARWTREGRFRDQRLPDDGGLPYTFSSQARMRKRATQFWQHKVSISRQRRRPRQNIAIETWVLPTHTYAMRRRFSSVLGLLLVGFASACSSPRPPLSRIPVPSVVGQTSPSATAKLQHAGFTVRSVLLRPEGNYIPAGQVAKISPTAGTALPRGSVVTIYVMTG